MIELFAISGTCSIAPHILLRHVGVPFELMLLDRVRRENRSAEYLAINPHGKVPALRVDGQVITENVAIQSYIADSFPDARLAPTEPLTRAQWLSRINWFSNTVHPSFRQTRRPEIFATDAIAYPAIVQKGRADFIACLMEMDSWLADHEWVVADRFTTADAYLHVFHLWALLSDLPIDQLASLRRHGKALAEMPAVRAALANERMVFPTID